MSVFLVGYMGSGKSSVGRRLANRLDIDFVDMDQLIEDYAKASVQDIFAHSGEETFRTLENHILEKLIKEEPRVIATGGGSPCHSGNMAKIREAGYSIYLELPPNKLARRVHQSNVKNPGKRPLVKGLEGQALVDFVVDHLNDRAPHYEEADMIVNGDKVNSALLDDMRDTYLDWRG